MGIANIINNSTTTSGGEIVRELVNSSDGQGLHLDTTSSHIAFTPVDLGTKCSFEFVVKATSWTDSTYKYLVDFGNGGRFTIGTDDAAGAKLAVYNGTDFFTFGASTLDDLKVHHLVVTVDGTSATLYDNGNQVGTATITTPDIDSCSAGRLGSKHNSTSGRFYGTYYRARFYNKALTSAEVQTAFERADVDFADQYGSQTSKILNGTSWTGASGSTKPNDWSLGLDGTFTIDSSSGSGAEPALKIQRNGSTNYPYIFQTFTAEIGKKYRVKYRVKNIDVGSGGNLRVGIGNTAVGTQYNVSDYTATSWTAFEEVYTATTTTFSVYLQVNTTTGTEGGYFDSVTVEQVGCVSDYDLAFANPTQSLTVQDRSGAADGTCSASGVSQVQPVVQLNATAARIGTTAATPADGAIIADKLGIGIAPSHAATIYGTGAGNATVQIEGEGGADPTINFLTNNTTHWAVGVDDSDSDKFKIVQHSAIGSTNNFLTIDSSGNALFNTSSSNPGNGNTDTGVSILSSGRVHISANTNNTVNRNSDGHVFQFRRSNSEVGSIAITSSATAFNTSSDYRLKENLTPLTGALDRLDQLPVYRFNFKADPDTTVDGFVAHEVSAHVPEAVTGEKDAMKTVVVQEAVEAQPATYYEEGDELPEGKAVGDEKTPAVEAVAEVTEEQPDYQGIDQSKLVPLLVAAVKELKAKVETLENA